MRYYVTLDGESYEVELGGDGLRVNGESVDADLATVAGTPVRHLLVDGRSHAIVAQRGEGSGHWRFHINGRRLDVEVIDERTRSVRAVTGATAAAHGPKPVRAPMPGMVVRVQVEPGQRVRPGDAVLIMEAMKMENELKAETTGVVARVHVAPGRAVEKDAILVEFEADPVEAD